MGTTVLDRSTVREAFTNQIGDLRLPAVMTTADPVWSCDVVTGTGTTWGWGLQLDAGGGPGVRAAGSGGWMGIFNTRFWVDPRDIWDFHHNVPAFGPVFPLLLVPHLGLVPLLCTLVKL